MEIYKPQRQMLVGAKYVQSNSRNWSRERAPLKVGDGRNIRWGGTGRSEPPASRTLLTASRTLLFPSLNLPAPAPFSPAFVPYKFGGSKHILVRESK